MPSNAKHSPVPAPRSAISRTRKVLACGAVAFATVASAAIAGGGGVSTSDGSGDGDGGRTHVFPIPSPHTYGDGFGAGRDHQGQDVFAPCGRKLVAVRDGRVQTVASHSSAGNYIVIDGAGTGADTVYMHLKAKAIPREGSRVNKGEKIGEVGETGNASGCHLHFEKWTSPGYYEGGEPTPRVTRALRTWDKYS